MAMYGFLISTLISLAIPALAGLLIMAFSGVGGGPGFLGSLQRPSSRSTYQMFIGGPCWPGTGLFQVK